jgi:hypothetical protein
MNRTFRFLAALVASCCTLLAFASLSSAQQVLYGADGQGGHPSNLLLLDPSSGAVLQTGGPIGLSVTGLALDPSTGTLYGVTGNEDAIAADHLITINRTTGAGTDVGVVGPVVNDITFTPDGTLFGFSRSAKALVAIDKTTGAGTVVGPSGISNPFGNGLASNAAGILYLAPTGDDGELYTVDRSTGAATPVATLDGTNGDAFGALAFDAAGTLFGALNHFSSVTPPDLVTIDTASGAIGVRGPSAKQLDAIVFAPKPARTVDLRKKTLKKGKKGKKVRLSGHVDAPTALRTLQLPAAKVPGNHSACDAGTTVELQRKTPKAASFATFRQLTTDSDGNFSTNAKQKKTVQYRAFLSENSLCGQASSNIQKVKKPKKKK